MATRWLGLVVASDKVTVVDATVPDSGAIVIEADESWQLQAGERPAAYCVMSQRVSDYAKEKKVELAALKATAISLGGTKMAHLEAAELRGVVMCALAGVTKVKLLSKSHMSRTFGDRKVDEYVKDDSFWSKRVKGDLRGGSREAAMLLLAARKPT